MLSLMFRTLENPKTPLTGRAFDAALAGRLRTSSGVRVGAGDFLSFSPVWSAVDQITSDIARLPWIPYSGRENRKVAREHPSYRLLASKMNENTTTNIWLIRMLVNALLYGNAYSVIKRNGTGYVTSCEFVPAWKVDIVRMKGTVQYVIRWESERDGKKPQTLDSDSVFHLQGLTLHECGGLSLIDYARDTVGRHLAANGYGDDFFANGAVPQGFFSHPKNMSQPAQERFVANMSALHGGRGNRHKVAVLEEDVKWINTGINPKDAMLIDMMQWGVPEVARYFKMPPHRLADPSRQGWNTTEAENRSYFSTTLGGWVDRLQWEANDKLFLEREKSDFYTEFDTSEMVKPTTYERYQAYGVAIQWGFMTRNEARSLEDLPTLDGLDDPLTPVNMTTDTSGYDASAGTTTSDPMNTELPQDSPEDQTEDTQQVDQNRALQIAQRDVLADQLERMTKRVTSAAARAAKEPRTFLQHVNSLDVTHRQAVSEALRPAASMVAALRGRDAVKQLDDLTTQFLGESSRALLEASEVQAEQLVSSVSEASVRLTAWGRELASQLIFGR